MESQDQADIAALSLMFGGIIAEWQNMCANRPDEFRRWTKLCREALAKQ